MKKNVFLFGAGAMGKEAIEKYGPFIGGFIDNNSEKDGEMVDGIPVFSYQHYISIHSDDDVVIITSLMYEKEIQKQLNEDGITNYLGNYFLKPYRINYEELQRVKGKTFCICSEQPEYTKFLLQNILECEINVLCINPVFSKHESLSEDAVVIVEGRDYAATKVRIENEYSNEIICLCRIGAIYEKEKFYFDSDWKEKPKTSASIKYNMAAPLITNYVRALADYETLAPMNITFETISQCNGLCSFCPVNARVDKRKKELMSMELFQNVVKQLEGMDYAGEIAMYGNNEPLLDPRIVEMTKYVREHVPKAMIRMLTNGTLITVELFDALIEYLDCLMIENYTDNCTMNERVQKIYDYCMEHPEKQKKAIIWMRRQTDIMSTRGGLAPNRESNRDDMDDVSKFSCAQPFQCFYIHPNGDCVICCADPFGEVILGNVNEQSVLEIWNGDKYKEIRSQIAKGRGYIQKCTGCDQFPYYCM